jgi:hypothetical protein
MGPPVGRKRDAKLTRARKGATLFPSEATKPYPPKAARTTIEGGVHAITCLRFRMRPYARLLLICPGLPLVVFVPSFLSAVPANPNGNL